jgi:hypothetical protein
MPRYYETYLTGRVICTRSVFFCSMMLRIRGASPCFKKGQRLEKICFSFGLLIATVDLCVESQWSSHDM